MTVRNTQFRRARGVLVLTWVIGSSTVAIPLHSQTNGPVNRYATSASPLTGSSDTSVRPFRIHIPQEALSDLRRLAAGHWPGSETVSDRSQGVPLATMKSLVRYWQNDYNWRKAEPKIHAFPQFVDLVLCDPGMTLWLL
jgi:hypothetical protein